MFRRKKKVVVKKPAISADDVIIGVAKTIGTAIGTASVAVDIGKQSASEARAMKPDIEKKIEIVKKNANGHKARELLEPAAKQITEASQMTKGRAKEAKKLAVTKVEKAKKVATDKVSDVKHKADSKSDELREAAAGKIAPRRRGLLGRIRG